MKAKYNMVVDFARPSKSNTIIVSEDDSESRVAHFTLLFNNKAFDMSDVTGALVTSSLPSSAIVLGDAELIYDEDGNIKNEVEYTIPTELTRTSGKVTMTITLTGVVDEQPTSITSFEFYITVRNSLYNDSDATSSADMESFRALYTEIKEKISVLGAMINEGELPNPQAMEITVDGNHYTYKGTKEEEHVDIKMGRVAYLGDSVGEVLNTVDESAATQAKASAKSAKESADAAEEYYNALNDIVPHVTITKSPGSNKSVIEISDANGLHSTEVYDGAKGDPGQAASINVGSVTTGQPGTSVQITNSGNSTNAVLNFTIPQGAKGDKGDKGEAGTAIVNSDDITYDNSTNKLSLTSEVKSQLNSIDSIENKAKAVFDSEKATPIPLNADLNNYRKSGSYSVATSAVANSLANIPVRAACMMHVYTGGDSQATPWATQEITTYNTNSDGVIWRRSIIANQTAWSVWKKILSVSIDSETLTYNGMTFNITDMGNDMFRVVVGGTPNSDINISNASIDLGKTTKLKPKTSKVVKAIFSGSANVGFQINWGTDGTFSIGFGFSLSGSNPLQATKILSGKTCYGTVYL